MSLSWEEEPLGKGHDRKAFDCGVTDLNLYLQRYARQNHESGGAKCFVATLADNRTRVLGFYTLSPASLQYSRTPVVAAKGLGRYDVPVFRLGRLAVDIDLHGRGLGGALLLRGRTLHARGSGRRRRCLADRCQDRSGRTVVCGLWCCAPS